MTAECDAIMVWERRWGIALPKDWRTFRFFSGFLLRIAIVLRSSFLTSTISAEITLRRWTIFCSSFRMILASCLASLASLASFLCHRPSAAERH